MLISVSGSELEGFLNIGLSLLAFAWVALTGAAATEVVWVLFSLFPDESDSGPITGLSVAVLPSAS